MLQLLKLSVYFFSKHIGLFYLSNFFYRKQLLILCYHGFQVQDEAKFRPGLFISTETFENRLELLNKYNKNICSLDSAVSNLYSGNLETNSAVLTIDDGFESVLTKAAPLLKKFNYPSTLYVTTYYVEKQTPIYGLTISYMFFKTSLKIIPATNFSGLETPMTDLTIRENKNFLASEIIHHGYSNCNETIRKRICENLSEMLQVSFEDIVTNKLFNLIKPKDLPKLVDYGIDIQLHTHRHNFPTDKPNALKEISENRDVLGKILRHDLNHFCYPSGIWSKEHFQTLKESGISSATTCLAGYNNEKTSRYSLNRILDSDIISCLEFEAHITGFSEIFRQLKKYLF